MKKELIFRFGWRLCVNYGDKILIAIGTPTASKLIDKLSQDDAYIFGKVLEIKKNDSLNTNLEKVILIFFSFIVRTRKVWLK